MENKNKSSRQCSYDARVLEKYEHINHTQSRRKVVQSCIHRLHVKKKHFSVCTCTRRRLSVFNEKDRRSLDICDGYRRFSLSEIEQQTSLIEDVFLEREDGNVNYEDLRTHSPVFLERGDHINKYINDKCSSHLIYNDVKERILSSEEEKETTCDDRTSMGATIIYPLGVTEDNADRNLYNPYLTEAYELPPDFGCDNTRLRKHMYVLNDKMLNYISDRSTSEGAPVLESDQNRRSDVFSLSCEELHGQDTVPEQKKGFFIDEVNDEQSKIEALSDPRQYRSIHYDASPGFDITSKRIAVKGWIFLDSTKKLLYSILRQMKSKIMSLIPSGEELRSSGECREIRHISLHHTMTAHLVKYLLLLYSQLKRLYLSRMADISIGLLATPGGGYLTPPK